MSPVYKVAVLAWAQASAAASALRYAVFTGEQGIDARLDLDGRDDTAWHALGSDAKGIVTGTGRLLIDGTQGRIGRMAVLLQARNSGLGGRMLNALCAKAEQLNLSAVVLHAQLAAVPFYRRHGFMAEGPIFLEAGIEHQQMRKTLADKVSTGTAMIDENLWLEDIEGPAAMAWVQRQNQISADVLRGDALFETLTDRLTSIFESNQRIPLATVRGEWLYNFWQDATNVRGLWRRTSLQSYQSEEPQWQTLLDLDLLAAAEQEPWVWAGAQVRFPDYRRALIRLSRGGGDAAVTREFDLDRLEFVADGFVVPHGKSKVSWIDADTIFVCADFGAGSLTDSGYPRIAKRWRRGSALAEASIEFAVEPSEMSVDAHCTHDWHDGVLIERQWIVRQITFSTSTTYLRVDDAWQALDLPEDADAGTFADRLLVTLKSDWTLPQGVFLQGSLLAISLQDFLLGKRTFDVLFTARPRCVLSGLFNTRHKLVVTQMNDLVQEAESWSLVDGTWRRESIALEQGVMSDLFAFDANQSDDFWILQSGPLFPTRLGIWADGASAAVFVKSLPGLFAADGMHSRRFDAISKDGTRVPYVVVEKIASTSAVPTLLSGYGGFEIARLPLPYSAAIGAAWLEGGGRYVVAGIRGGGEYGPAWHLDAIREKKQNCFDDFIAVAQDLVARGLAQAAHLGIQGGSNGGLLVGAVMTQAPELFGAVVCQVPLLDMSRYHKLLAGASWVAEYGDPDLPSDWSFISSYSPYQKLDAQASYPPIFLATSTRDDRVHPGHARKMAARMQAMGHRVLYYENIEGGHAGAANQRQAAELNALAYTFLWQTLR